MEKIECQCGVERNIKSPTLNYQTETDTAMIELCS